MACYHPLMAFQDEPGSPLYRFVDSTDPLCVEEWKKVDEHPLLFPYRAVKVPCQQCLGCRITYTRNWAIRCMLEAKMYPPRSCWFVTLTYDDEHLPLSYACDPVTGEVTYETHTLIKDHPKKFMKDLREYCRYHFGWTGLRVFYCGEYGTKSQRPHYHLIIFGLPFDESHFSDFKYQKKGKSLLYEIDYVSKCWNKGLAPVGELTFDSAAYVAGYMLKKVKGKHADEYYLSHGIIPEFSEASRRPGLARSYFDMYSDKIYEEDSLGLKFKSNLIARPPSYFDKLYKVDHCEEFYQISDKRKLASKEAMKIRTINTGLTEDELLRKDEDNLKSRLKLSVDL